MRAMAIAKPVEAASGTLKHHDVVSIEGFPIAVGFVDIDPPTFDPDAPENRSLMLVEVEAFSCNYRDRALAVQGVWQTDLPFLHFGSDFVANVLEVGRNVVELSKGDRVIGDNQYPVAPYRGVRPGIPTNHASARFLRLHESKLAKIPPTMPIDVAAAFSVCAQTSYSLLRRLKPCPGERGLITAARSSTSLCVLSGLRSYDVEIHALSTGSHPNQDLEQFRLSSVTRLNQPIANLEQNELIRDLKRRTGGFDFIIDPFADVYLGEVLGLLVPGGRYITCGFLNQMAGSGVNDNPEFSEPNFDRYLEQIIVNNISVIGTCLGHSADLQAALEDYVVGSFDVLIDSTFSGNEAAGFFRQSFAAANRLGRPVFVYETRER